MSGLNSERIEQQPPERKECAMECDNRDLSSQQAADLLNVSLRYMVQLLDEGRIKSSGHGFDRTVKSIDLMAYKAKDDEARVRIAIELTQEAQELRMGYEIGTVVCDASRKVNTKFESVFKKLAE